jgi:hypothetical protein
MRKLFLAFALLLVFACKKDNDNSTALPNPYSNQAVGASANHLLSSTNASTLKIEIQYMSGFAPDAGALSHFENLLNNILYKPGGISIVQTEISSGGKTTYTLNDIKSIEEQKRTAYTIGTTIAVYILIVDGAYSDPAVLGIAYRNTSIVLLGKTIHDNSGNIGQASRTKLEATVLEHEFGHLCGLVNIGSPMQTNHQDTGHGNHCDNNNCLMYYASETTDILGFLLTGSIPAFDANCSNDLHANGGR